MKNNHFHFGKVGKASLLAMKNNAFYVWMVIVPERANLTDLDELDEETYTDVMLSARRVAKILKEELGFVKVNIASISIAVPQLHVQVIGRRETDPSWPGVPFGHDAKK